MANEKRRPAWDLVDDPGLDPETRENLVENLTATVGPGMPLAALVAGMNVEATERRGQEQFVASDILPTEIQDPYKAERGAARKIMQAWGFTFGKVIEGDKLFQQARIPPGWKKKGSAHDMWSYILDDQGRERCSVFYKAAHYDRRSFMSLTPRYLCDREYESPTLRQAGRSRGIVKEGEKVLFTGEWRTNPRTGTDYEKKYGAYEAAQKDAREWFQANLPEDFVAQWARP